MKIAIVTDAWEPQVNGVVCTLKTTVREIEALGHQVDVLSPQDFRLALATPGMVARALDAVAPDCLHIATEGPLGWAARRVALRRGWPFTTAWHRRLPEYLQLRTGLPLEWSYAALRRFHNAGNATLVPTESMVAELRARGFTRPTLWSRGVNLELFHPDGPRLPRGEAPVFLHVGRLAVEKDVDAFLRLDLPGEKWVVGTGPEEARLRARYPGVRWFGVLQGHELARLYRSADVMVFPSRTDTFGLVLIEAMACGTPVAALPVTGPVDVVGHCGAGGALHRDLKTACLVALHGSPRAQVRAFAERYTWTAATQQFMQALQPIRPPQPVPSCVYAGCAAPPTSR